jgi:hypothetical protein
VITTQHTDQVWFFNSGGDFCDSYAETFTAGCTGDVVRIGRSLICYRYSFTDPTAPICVYTRIDDCNVKCMSPELRLEVPPPPLYCTNYALEERRWKKYKDGRVECLDTGIAYFSNLQCYCQEF